VQNALKMVVEIVIAGLWGADGARMTTGKPAPNTGALELVARELHFEPRGGAQTAGNRKSSAYCRWELQRASAEIGLDGRTLLAERAGKMSKKAAGRKGWLHGLIFMCLPLQTLKSLEEPNQGFDIGIFNGVGKDRVGLSRRGKGAQRFALGLYGGALPRTPDSFTLRDARFAGWGIKLEVCCRMDRNWRASRWLSASRRWRCRPSQPRIGLSNRLPGFWSDRTPLAHKSASRGAVIVITRLLTLTYERYLWINLHFVAEPLTIVLITWR
jgi:hypothetical protein